MAEKKDTPDSEDNGKGKAADKTVSTRPAPVPVFRPGSTQALTHHGPQVANQEERAKLKNVDGSPLAPGREPDHADAVKAREEAQALREEHKAARVARREAASGGSLKGNFVAVGNRLVNMDNLFAVDLPAEGDPYPTVTLTSTGGSSVVMAGEDAAEFMKQFGLEPLPPATMTAKNTVTEDGRLVSLEDRKAEAIPGRELRIPNHPHRANAVLNNAETDAQVLARAGNVAVPPTRPMIDAPLPTEPVASDDTEGDDSAAGKTRVASRKSGAGKRK